MEMNEFPLFGFVLEYARKLIYCEVSMREVGYDIHFNNVWKASAAHTVGFTWIQAPGAVLPKEIIREIGFRIEDRYK